MLLCLITAGLAGFDSGANTGDDTVHHASEDKEIAETMTLKDLENATLGIISGTNWDLVVQNEFPNAERKYYLTGTDVLLALQQGKIDAYFADKTTSASLRWDNAPIDYIDEPIKMVSNALILPKEGYDEKLLEQINAFVAEKKDDGTLAFLQQKWFGDSEPEEHPDYTKLTGENGTLKVAVGDTMKPTSYQRGMLYTGYEVDFMTLFAETYGYKLDIYGMSFNALVSTVASGKCDIGACGITINPERAESVMFANPHLETYGVAIIRSGEKLKSGFWNEMKHDFEKTFIREDRWKLILDGMGVTVMISIASVIGGTLFGFGLYILSFSESNVISKMIRGFAKIHSLIIAGTPTPVILLILYYVVFGRIRNMSGIVISIICFILTFGAFVYEHTILSVNSVDQGQREAAYALGYTRNKTFFRVIFPQAMMFFMPSYSSQVVELIKATSVVGYIAVSDLTTIGDLIRSNTYEAFFPLIAIAAIYFLLTWLASVILSFISMRFEPKRRSKKEILKGVKTV